MVILKKFQDPRGFSKAGQRREPSQRGRGKGNKRSPMPPIYRAPIKAPKGEGTGQTAFEVQKDMQCFSRAQGLAEYAITKHVHRRTYSV